VELHNPLVEARKVNLRPHQATEPIYRGAHICHRTGGVCIMSSRVFAGLSSLLGFAVVAAALVVNESLRTPVG